MSHPISVRIPRGLLAACRAEAQLQHLTLTDVILNALRSYLKVEVEVKLRKEKSDG